MKQRKKRFCMKCNGEVRRDRKVPNYSFYCVTCDENMFNFETYKSKKKSK